jgi:hypothetical protein
MGAAECWNSNSVPSNRAQESNQMNLRRPLIMIVLSVMLSSPVSPAASWSSAGRSSTAPHMPASTNVLWLPGDCTANNAVACCSVCWNNYTACNGGNPTNSNACSRSYNDCMIGSCGQSCPNNDCAGSPSPSRSQIPSPTPIASRGQATYACLSEHTHLTPACNVK